MVEKTDLICPHCGREFPSTQALGSHIFWKHEYLKWKENRQEAIARGEPVASVKGLGRVPDRDSPGRKREPWFEGKLSKVVRGRAQLLLLE